MPSVSRTKNVANFAAAGYLRMAFGAGVTLATTRLCFEVLKQAQLGLSDTQVFGILSLLYAVAGVTQFLQDGPANASIRLLARCIATDPDSLPKAFSSCWAFGFGGGLLRGLLLASIAGCVPWFLNIHGDFAATLRLGTLLLAAGTVLEGLLSGWNMALYAQERYGLVFSRLFVAQVLRLGMTWAAPWSPGGVFIGLVLSFKVPDLLTLGAVALWECARNAAWRVRFRAVDRATLRHLATLGGWRGLEHASWSLFVRMDQVVCTRFLGPAMNAAYALADQIRTQLGNFSGTINGVLLPSASKLAADSNAQGLRRMYIHALRITLGLALGPAIVLSVFAGPAVLLWLGPGHDRAASVLPLALAVFLVRIPVATSWNVLTATDDLARPVLVQVFEGLINQGLSIALIVGLGLGLEAIYYGTLIACVPLLFLFYFPYLARVLGTRVWALAFESLGTPLLGAALLTLGCLWVRAMNWSWPGTVASLGILAFAYSAWFWRSILEGPQRRAIWEVLALS